MKSLARRIALGLAVLSLGLSPLKDSRRLSEERVIFRTTLGDLVFAFYPEIAPRHVSQILRLVRLGAFDTIRIHRVEPRFVVQFSTAFDRLIPLTARQSAAIEKIPGEFSAGIRHQRGILSMARYENDPNSAETSFSILLADAPHLDGKYTVFGQLEAGWDVLEAIEKIDRRGTEPVRRLTVESARVIDASALASFPLVRASRAAQEADSGRYPLTVVIGLLGALALGGVLLFLLAGHISPQRLGSLGLAVTLVSGFAMLVLATPMAQREPGTAVLVFLGLIGMFKLMNQFEKPRA